MKITVTQEDIDRGCRTGDAWNCAIARAIRRTARVKNVEVGSITITFRRRDLPTPLVARKFIKRYDAGKRVNPFSFWLGSAEPFVAPVPECELVES